MYVAWVFFFSFRGRSRKGPESFELPWGDNPAFLLAASALRAGLLVAGFVAKLSHYALGVDSG